MGSQNVSAQGYGAFTGEVSALHLKDLGISHTLVGHSERRKLFGERNEMIFKKTQVALQENLNVVFCCGEQLSDRESNKTEDVVRSQLEGLETLEINQWSRLVIAYEPVWAIGTGETASPEQAQEMHAFIRSIIQKHYNTDIANAVSILYGGSVKPENAQEIFSKPDVDGGLIGGASLKAADFTAIINAI